MKSGTHPKFFVSKISCAGCGASFEAGSTLTEINVAICSECHPFYTGKSKLVDSEGRVDRFKKKFANYSTNKSAAKSSAA